MAFDPDAYLAQKPAGFDPDAYLGAQPAPAAPRGPTDIMGDFEEYKQKLDPRRLMPGVAALLNPTGPEAQAEQQAYATIKDPRTGLMEKFEAFERTPMAGLLIGAPRAGPAPLKPATGVAGWLRTKAGERNLKAAGGIQSDITRSRRQLGPGGVDDGRAALTEIGAEMGEKKLVGPLSSPASTFDRSAALMDDAGERMGALLKAADEAGASRPQWQSVLTEGQKILAELRKDPNRAAAANNFEELLAGYAEKAGLSRPSGPITEGASRSVVQSPPTTRDVRRTVPAPASPDAPPWMARTADVVGTETVPGASRTVTHYAPPPAGARGATDISYERPLTFEGLHGLRKQVDQALYGMRGTKDPWADAYKQALHDLRSAVSREIETNLDAATAGTPAWKAANRDYQVGAKALEFADKGMDRATGNNMVSLSELMAALSGVAAGGAHSPGLAGLGGLTLGGGTALARRYGSGTLGAAMLKASNRLRTPSASERFMSVPGQAGLALEPEIRALLEAMRIRPAQAGAEEDQ
jgi:hypothetical protein